MKTREVTLSADSKLTREDATTIMQMCAACTAEVLILHRAGTPINHRDLHAPRAMARYLSIATADVEHRDELAREVDAEIAAETASEEVQG